ncbi:MAG: uracil-DNA glycosylase [Planctomycetaceae bacterium]
MQQLRSWQSAGLTHLPRRALDVELPSAVDTAAAPVLAAATESTPIAPAFTAAPAPPSPAPQTSDDDMPAAGQPLSLEQRQRKLARLAKQVAACTRCRELAATRTQTVFGVGNPEARVMFIGEAPGADEDAQGEPFIGRAGQLLTKIIAACGWTREEIYICNILRCRPPENRNPTDEEAANCREWLDGQIATVNPEYIVCWGSVAAKNMLGSDETIGKLRRQWFEYGRAKVLCTYHPSYLLRNPAAKKPVWDDMLMLLDEMGVEPPRR